MLAFLRLKSPNAKEDACYGPDAKSIERGPTIKEVDAIWVVSNGSEVIAPDGNTYVGTAVCGHAQREGSS